MQAHGKMCEITFMQMHVCVTPGYENLKHE